jgi:hypothetical protein
MSKRKDLPRVTARVMWHELGRCISHLVAITDADGVEVLPAEVAREAAVARDALAVLEHRYNFVGAWQEEGLLIRARALTAAVMAISTAQVHAADADTVEFYSRGLGLVHQELAALIEQPASGNEVSA